MADVPDGDSGREYPRRRPLGGTFMTADTNTGSSGALAGVVQGGPRAGMVDLGPGYLDADLVPVTLIGRWATVALEHWGAGALAYGADAGPLPLRAFLAARVAALGATACGPDNVMTTGGTSQALDYLAARLSREGRVVLTEALTYDLGRLIFEERGVRTVAVTGPADDLDPAEFAHAIKQAVRVTGQPPALYLIPTFHNPTGRVISADRGTEILTLAHEAGALLIEDQAYAGLSYEPAGPPPPLWHSAPDPERVISLYSFAKCLAPGLRVGWLVSGERAVAGLAADATRRSGGGPSHFAAMVIAGGCLTSELDEHVATVREQLGHRRDVLLAALEGHLPDGFLVRRPAGGFFAWIDVPKAVDDEALLRDAEHAGVSFAAGRRFGASARGVRLCFAACGPRMLEQGATRFLHACQMAVACD